MSDKEIYDLVIIGAGPAGLTAGLYAARARMKTLILERGVPGGQVLLTHRIENFPGFKDGVSSFELIKNMDEQARKYGTEIVNSEVLRIKEIKEKNKIFEIETTDKIFLTYSLIVATGAEAKKMGVIGEEEFIGKGVSYCATCDAPFYKDKEVIVVGGGDAAVEEALVLTNFARKVYLIHRRSVLRATKILQERVLNNPKIKFVGNCVVEEIKGVDKVEEVKILNLKDKSSLSLKVDGIFIFVGHKPSTEFLKGFLSLDKDGFIITDDEMKTEKEGVFASGDVRRKILRQIITACGEGATAAFSAQRYVEELKGGKGN